MKCRTRGCCVCYFTSMFPKTPGQSPFKTIGCWVKQECIHFPVYLFTSVLSLYSNYLLYRTLTAASKHSWIQWDFIRLSHWLCRAQSVGSQAWIKVCLQESSTGNLYVGHLINLPDLQSASHYQLMLCSQTLFNAIGLIFRYRSKGFHRYKTCQIAFLEDVRNGSQDT